ncbi:hypothetical protein [uncultured Zobellia sp.]|uniref:hypothetical protein n=1 Tax=uncultured Zobellia sp. TaxID=255433 RepID=UPI002598CFDD|nr:hypothetical protein [uncultured Zobellia sp.]
MRYIAAEDIDVKLNEIKSLMIEVKNNTEKDYSLTYYTYKQVAEFISSDYQTVRNYVANGYYQVDQVGTKKLIHHYQVFNKDNTIKNFRYKRKA